MRQAAGTGAMRGYVLATTLVMLALLALIAERLAHRTELMREQSSSLAALADGLADASSARARTLYRMLTEPISARGFGRFDGGAGAMLPIDGHGITTDGDTVVALQDERGLLSVNTIDRPAFRGLLLQQGVDQRRIDRLIDTLEDYTDTDSLRRLNGAEAPDYETLGLPPPRNDWIASTRELAQVIDWRDDLALVEKLMPFLSARRDGFYDCNASPRAVLEARFPRAQASQIDQFIARRRQRPFGNAAEARAATGLPFNDDLDLFYPGDLFRLRIRPAGVPIAFEYTVWLTPGGTRRPWQFLDARTIFQPPDYREPEDRSKPAAQPDEAAPAQGLSP